MTIPLKNQLQKSTSFRSVVLFGCLAITACSGMANKQSNLENKDWPSFGRDYTNQRLSPLTQINQQNVKDLKLAWQFKSGVVCNFSSHPNCYWWRNVRGFAVQSCSGTGCKNGQRTLAIST